MNNADYSSVETLHATFLPGRFAIGELLNLQKMARHAKKTGLLNAEASILE